MLTGTPLENRLEELISIVQFVDRYRLGPTFRLLHDHQIRDEVGKVVGYRDLDHIGKTLAPILLRRQKDEVLDQLPERIDNNVFVPMTPAQQRCTTTRTARSSPASCRSGGATGFLSEADQQRLMIALQNMRMSCDSTYLLDHETDQGFKADEAHHAAGRAARAARRQGGHLQPVAAHARAARSRRLKQRGWGHVLFHGGVPARAQGRWSIASATTRVPRVPVHRRGRRGAEPAASPSVVVNMDLPWNPAVLEQRIGRVHRLGQKQPVQVVNFVAQGTIEEGMLSVLEFKKSLFAGVLDGGEKEVFLRRHAAHEVHGDGGEGDRGDGGGRGRRRGAGCTGRRTGGRRRSTGGA